MGNQPAPDGVAFWPDVLALVVKALAVLVEDDGERHAVESRDDAAIELGRASVDGDTVALRRVTDALGAGIEHVTQDLASIVGRAADEEVARRRPPGTCEPVEIGLKAA